MDSQSRTRTTLTTLNPLNPALFSTKTFIPRGLGNAYRRIGAKIRRTRSMDRTELELSAASLNSPLPPSTVGGDHVRRADSPVSTRSGSSPGTSQGKASMDAERNARPFPNGFTPSASRPFFLTPPSRRIDSVPFTLPPHVAMGRPLSSNFPSIDSHTSIPSSPTSAPSAELDTLSSSSCAEAIAARAAAADSSPPLPPKSQPHATSSPSPPSSPPTPFFRPQKAHTALQQPAMVVQSRDVGSLKDLSDALDAPLPPIPVQRATHHPACLTPGFLSSRPVMPHLSASSPLPSKFSIEGVSARLSPAIITRQPQHPILSLPPISPTSSPINASRRLRSQSLRSVPALPMEGSEDLEPAEHDNAALDDLDEEEEGGVDGDEDAEEGTGDATHLETASEDGESVSPPPSSETPRARNLPVIDIPPLDMTFLKTNSNGAIRRDDKMSKEKRMSGYFATKVSEPTSHTPLLNSNQFPAGWTSARTTPALPVSTPSANVSAAAWATSATRALPTPTTPMLNPRTSIYHQASRSMSDMSEILKRQHHTPEVAAKTPKSPFRDPALEADAAAADTEEPDTQLGPSLRRRLSMPMFGPSSAPPPYPQFHFGKSGPTIQPREEEGRERLPHYTNDIYLRAILPRKMEFSEPGVQARDRKWRRTLCILEGTAFRIYKCRPTDAGKGLIGNLWEKTVGVGDIATPTAESSADSAKAQERDREREARQSKFDRADGMTAQSPTPTSPGSSSAGTSSRPPNDSEIQSSSSARSRLLPSNFRRRNRAVTDGSSASYSEFGGTRRPFSAMRQDTPDFSSGNGASLGASPSLPNQSTSSSSTSPNLSSPRPPRTPRVKRRHLWVDDPAIPLPQDQDLLHTYALANAESGLGSDYLKRRNVIRVRMEGQQFLLQARDVASVVDWIEGFQAAANIALDLDERPMPKGPLFPRRRRRRARAQAPSS